MDDYSPPTQPRSEYAGLMLAAALMATGGWVGLWLLVTTTLPTASARWLFFVLLYLAVTGTVLPFARFLNARFTRGGASAGVVLRQSLWVGLYVVASAWLQISRVLSPVIAFLLALSLVVIEVFLHVRE